MPAENKKETSVLARIVLVAGSVLLVFVIVAVVKETYKKNQIQAMINDLQAQAEKVNRENSEIRDKVAYLESQDYRKKEAKDKLNLQEPGEEVVVIKPTVNTQEKLATVTESVPLPIESVVPNPQKWWNHFFKY